jgi:peptidoglycan/LPS O-acetylase OafA/YrhL
MNDSCTFSCRIRPLNPSAINPPRAVRHPEPPSAPETSPAPPPAPRFPGFDALRIYAALSVVIGHTNRNFGGIRSTPANIPLLDLLFMDTQSAVNVFLVLSGFLITYLIFREQSTAARLDTRRFYLRRILRTWPLYYLTVFIGLCVVPWLLGASAGVPASNPWSILLVLALMPNFTTGVSPALEHLWCIGLQNQFYLIWPAVTRPPAGRFLRIVFGILIVKVAITPVILGMRIDSITNIFYGLRFECFAIGALGAYLVHTDHPWLRFFRGVPARIAGLAGMAILAIRDLPLSEPAILFSSCIFFLVILNLSSGAGTNRRPAGRGWAFFGEISYGVYMFHYPLLYIALQAFRLAGIPEGASHSIILHAAVTGGSVLLAALSYLFFERPFLQLKKKLSARLS